MSNDIRFYRVYYPKLGWILFGIGLTILVLTSLCLITLLMRREPDYYASSLQGLLIPLSPIKIDAHSTKKISA